MPAITVRGISQQTHDALRARALRHGRSTEAEVRAILEAAAGIEPRVRLGSLLVDISHATGGVEIEYERDTAPHEPIDLT